MCKYSFNEVMEQLKANPCVEDHMNSLPVGDYPYLFIHFDDRESARNFLEKAKQEFGINATGFAYECARLGEGYFKKGGSETIFGVVRPDREFIREELHGEYVIELSDINMSNVDDQAFMDLLEC